MIQLTPQVPEGTPVFTPGTELAEEFEELKPKDGEAVVNKKHPGSFAETNLDELLKKTGLKRVLCVGYMAHVCVSTTVREGAQRGYDVLVAQDAIGDRDIPGASAEQLVEVSAPHQEHPRLRGVALQERRATALLTSTDCLR